MCARVSAKATRITILKAPASMSPAVKRRAAITSGLCSVTFRNLDPADVIRLAANAGLACIEWGGDIHVPHGDIARANDVAKLTRESGLLVSSYGSYWRADGTAEQTASLPKVLDSAQALGTRIIRVWAGRTDGRTATAQERSTIAASLRQGAEAAQARDIILACEFHDGTLACTGPSALRLLAEEAAHPSLRCYWQPQHGQSDQICLDSLQAVSPWLLHLHVFHWWPGPDQRFSLSEGRSRWSRFLAAVPDDGIERAALLEFLPGDDPAILAGEARILNSLIAGLPVPT
jgi:3-dehydroshikimate dehydratase